MTAPAGTGTLVVGGRFTRLSGSPAFGIGALDLVTGAPRPFAADSVVRDAGQDAAITDLASAGGTVYGSGYVFGADGNLEGTFAADAATGAISWVDGCMGDSYSVAPVGPVLYSAGHSHDCSVVGGHPEKNPRDYQRAVATTSATSPLGRTDHAGVFAGRPAPEILHWLPQLDAGTYTGQTQAAWSVRAGGGYVVMAGEFPEVDGVAQQGLVRFAAGAAAPAATDADKPIGYATLKPVAATVQPGRVRLSWLAAWDRDSASLRYELLRGTRVVATQSAPSAFWARPRLSAVDTGISGPTSYRVRVTDGSGRTMTSQATVVDVPAGTTAPPAASPLTDAITADAPAHLWRLDGGGVAGTALDSAGATDLALPPTAVPAAPTPTGARAGLGGTAFSGGAATTSVVEQGPQSFTAEAWLRTTTTTGGALVGFESSATAASGSHDRQVWMRDDGRVSLGVNDGRLQVLTTPGALNDGAWHQVVAVLNGGTTELFVDGALAASADGVRQAQAFDGFWRVGGGTLSGWPGAPTTTPFTGDLADVALYRAPLSAQRVAAHHAAATAPTSPVVPVPPPSADQALVAAWYAQFLGRSAAADPGAQFWVKALEAGQDPGALLGQILRSPEHVTASVRTIYRTYLARDPDPGAAYWVGGVVRGDFPLEWVEQNVASSGEYLARADVGTSVAGWYAAVLGRAPSGGERAYWAGRVGAVGALSALREIWYTSEAVTARVQAHYRDLLGRTAGAGEIGYWYRARGDQRRRHRRGVRHQRGVPRPRRRVSRRTRSPAPSARGRVRAGQDGGVGGLRVLVAHPGAELYGSDRVVLESVRALAAAGCTVTVALPGHGPLVAPLERAGATVVLCPSPGAAPRGGPARAGRWPSPRPLRARPPRAWPCCAPPAPTRCWSTP